MTHWIAENCTNVLASSKHIFLIFIHSYDHLRNTNTSIGSDSTPSSSMNETTASTTLASRCCVSQWPNQIWGYIYIHMVCVSTYTHENATVLYSFPPTLSSLFLGIEMVHLQTLERSYLLKIHGKGAWKHRPCPIPITTHTCSLFSHKYSSPQSNSIFAVAERPQHMFMRVAVGIHSEDIDAAIEVDIALLKDPPPLLSSRFFCFQHCIHPAYAHYSQIFIYILS